MRRYCASAQPEDGKARARFLRPALLATLFNALSIATFGAAFVVPLAQGQFDLLSDGHWILIPVALALHLAGHAAVRLMRRED